jgi:hypothetical protein
MALYNKMIVEQNDNWFKMLISCIEDSTLTQDSICCVNTALIILIFADRKGKFQEIIDKFKNTTFINKNKEEKNLLDNFYKILNVW